MNTVEYDADLCAFMHSSTPASSAADHRPQSDFKTGYAGQDALAQIPVEGVNRPDIRKLSSRPKRFRASQVERHEISLETVIANGVQDSKLLCLVARQAATDHKVGKRGVVLASMRIGFHH